MPIVGPPLTGNLQGVKTPTRGTPDYPDRLPGSRRAGEAGTETGFVPCSGTEAAV